MVAGPLLEIEVFGDESTRKHLLSMGRRMIFAEPALQEIAPVFAESEQALFSRGRSWAPNAPATIERKGRNDPLVRTGALERSLTEVAAPGAVRRFEDDVLFFGTNIWYAKMATSEHGNVPKRDVFKLRASDRAKIRGIVRHWVMHGTGSR
jgi:hypothetical protein